jgi:hypothetical protein
MQRDEMQIKTMQSDATHRKAIKSDEVEVAKLLK